MSYHSNYSRNYDDIKYSYLIVRKGERPDPSHLQNQTYHWPRMVHQPLKRKKHVILDVCSPQGEIIRINASKSHGNQIYKDARKSRWGDLWPHPPQGKQVVRDMSKKQSDQKQDEKEDLNKCNFIENKKN